MPMKCESCGMPTKEKYCKYCTDEHGNLKSREDVREGMINLYIRLKNLPREDAEKFVDEYMKKMPAWS